MKHALALFLVLLLACACIGAASAEAGGGNDRTGMSQSESDRKRDAAAGRHPVCIFRVYPKVFSKWLSQAFSSASTMIRRALMRA